MIKYLLNSFKKEPKENNLLKILNAYGLNAKIVEINKGPSFTQYVLNFDKDISLKKLITIRPEIAVKMKSPNGTVRIEAPIHGTDYVGIEVPNDEREVIAFEDIIDDISTWDNSNHLKIPLGIDVKRNLVKYDIMHMPHMLIADTTGSEKSQLLHNIIISLMRTKKHTDVKFILIDPRKGELGHYKDSPYLNSPVITDPKEGLKALLWLADETERRYKFLEQERTRNVHDYNEKMGSTILPSIVIIVDEFEELMAFNPTTVEKCIVRVAQLTKVTDLHIILTTSNPSQTVYTGLIKANIPTRVAFNTASDVDSRVIIDQPGAEILMGNGDMLFIPPNLVKPIRLQTLYDVPEYRKKTLEKKN